MKNFYRIFGLKAMYVFVAIVLFMVGVGVKGVEGQTYNHANTTTTTCSGTFYDHAGTANYSNSQTITQTFYPSTAGAKVRVNFSSFSLENGWDGLMIYNGNSTAAPIISSGSTFGRTTCPNGAWTGTTSPGTITSTAADGSLTFRFTSDGSVTSTGWVASISCFTPPPAEYQASFTSMNTGSTSWCPSETRNVTVTITNTGTATWTNTGADINIGCKWNTDADFNVRTDANNLAPDASQTYTITMTAPSTPGAYTLSFNIVYESCFWFNYASGTYCGVTLGNTPNYTSASQTIVQIGENCNCPQDLATLTSPYSGTTVGYADDIATCRTGGPDRIFYINVPANYTLNIGETTNSYDEYEYLGYGSNCSSTTQIYCWDNDGLAQMSWTNTTGSDQTVWYIQDAFSGGSGTFTLQWALVAPPPSNPGNPTSNSPQNCSVTLTRTGTPPAGETWYWQTSASGTDMTYSGSTYTAYSSGTYYIRSRRISDGVWSSGAGSVSVIVNTPGDQTSYGNGSWIGYTYSAASAGAFTTYIGFVTETETFNRTHTSPLGVTTNLCSNPTDMFTIRYRMNKNFSPGLYTFTIGGDDGVRLSIDGGSTWLINGWVDQGYTTYSSAQVYLSGSYNLVFEFYENGGSAQSSFAYTLSPDLIVPSSGNNSYSVCSGNLYDAGGSAGNYNNNWNGNTVLYPGTAGNMIQISGSTTGETCCDYIYIYNGAGIGGTLLWSDYAGIGTIPTITSTDASGALTVQFTSDVSVVGAGFNISISCVPATPGTPSSNSPGCGNVTITRNGAPPAGETWYWQTTSNGTDMSSSAATYVVSSSGTYYIRSRRNADGVWGAAASITVVVKPIPTAVTAGTDATICYGNSTQLNGAANISSISGSSTFTNSASICDGGSYGLGTAVSVTSSGFPAGATITSITYSTAIDGILCNDWYSTRFYVNGGQVSAPVGCTNTNSAYTGLNGQNANGQVFSLHLFDMDGWASPTGDCVNGTISVTVNYTYTPTVIFSWTPTTTLSDPNISNPTATPSSTTTYTMTATANGCGMSDDVTITVVQRPTVGTMSISESAICEGETVTISNTASNGTIYYWASSEGGYPCNWDIINQGYGGSNSFDYSFSANPNTSICEANPYRIHVYSASYNATCGWSWDYGSGSSQYINVYPAPSWNTITPNTSGVYCELDGVFLSATVNNPDPSSSVTWQRLPYSLATWTTGIANNAIDYPTPNIYEYQPVYTTTITGCDLSSPVTVSIDMFNSGDWTGNTSSNWHDASNWCGNTVPNSSSSVVIPGGTLNYPEISNGDASICDINIGGGAQLTISNNRSLNVYCSFTNNGTFISGNNNESVVIKGNPTDLTTGNDDFNFLTIDAGAFMDLHDDLDIKRNFVNNGTFAQTGNTIRFMGSVPQYVTCGASQFEDVTIDNSSTGTANIILNDDFNIIDHLVLDNGVIDPNGNSMNFGAASNVTVNSTASFVNGKMQYTGSSLFTFPAGHVNSRDLDGNSIPENYTVYSPISVTPSANATVEVEFIFDNTGMPDWWEHGGNMAATLHHVSDREYWYVNSDQNLSDVTLYWYDNGHTVGNICTHGFDNGNPADFVASDLTVAYWSGSQWVDAGGTVTGDHDNGYITSANSISFGAKAPRFITFGSKNNLNPLPVELTFFNGECADGETTLFWQTASETNNSHFLVQVSDNMKDFEILAKIDGAGNSSLSNDYTYKLIASTEMQYYRLIQIDFDGKTKTYPPISVLCKDYQLEPKLSVYPNPFESEIYIILEYLNSDTAIIEIINSVGQIIYKNPIEVKNGFVRKDYDLSNLKPGMYQFRVISGVTVLSSKIIKK